MTDRRPHDDRPVDDPTRNEPADRPEREIDPARLEGREAPQGAAAGTAHLEGVPGVGTLQVVRDGDGRVLHVEGTWRPEDEGVDASPIDAALEAGRELRYEGKLDDPSFPDRSTIDVAVIVTSRSTYTWNALPEDDGRTLPLYNFRPREGGAMDG